MTSPAADDEPAPAATPRIRPFLAAGPLPAGAPEDGTPLDSETGAPAVPRPFVITSGRVTAADPAIGLETQVTARFDGDVGWILGALPPEPREILLLCREPLSVAEISARLRLHLGVTRILVGDLRAAGHVDVHTADADPSASPDLILRVINGLRALS